MNDAEKAWQEYRKGEVLQPKEAFEFAWCKATESARDGWKAEAEKMIKEVRGKDWVLNTDKTAVLHYLEELIRRMESDSGHK